MTLLQHLCIPFTGHNPPVENPQYKVMGGILRHHVAQLHLV